MQRLKFWLIGLSLLLVGCQSQANEKATTVVSHAAQQRSTKQSRHSATVPIHVTIAGHRLAAHLNRSTAAKQLANRLPVSYRFNGMGEGQPERTSDLKHPLSWRGMSQGANSRPGDIAYWSPQPRLVFYWGNVGAYPGIHIIGHFDDRRAIKVIRQQHHAFTAKITAK